MDKYQIYRHRTPDGKVYIGCTKQSLTARWGRNGESYCSNLEFWNAIQKFGWDNIQHEVIAVESDRGRALELESELIHKHKATDSRYGYNKMAGPKYREESNQEFRQVKRLQSIENWSKPEYRALVSERVSQAKIGIHFTHEHRSNIGKAKIRINLQKGQQAWIHDDAHESLIPISELPIYLEKGWLPGRLNDKNVYMHKSGMRDIKVATSDIQNYQAGGWTLGRGETTTKNVAESKRVYTWLYQDKQFSSSFELTNYLREHGYPKIAPSTVTGIARGQVFPKYQELSDKIVKILIKKGGFAL